MTFRSLKITVSSVTIEFVDVVIDDHKNHVKVSFDLFILYLITSAFFFSKHLEFD